MLKAHQLLLLALFIGIGGAWSVHLGQDINWDLRNYHFYNAYAFLHHRMGWDIAPAMLQTYINPFMDILNYALIVSQKPIVTGFILGAVSGVSAFILYNTALLLTRRPLYAAFATLIGATGCASISQLGTTTNENKIALLVILSFYFILKAISYDKPQKHIGIGGFCIGLAVGFKLTAMTYGLGIFVGLLGHRKFSREQAYQLFLFTLAAAAGFFVANGYWLWKMYSLFGNPLFPYYNNIFHSPYAAFESFAGTAFKPQDWLHYLFLPFYLVKNNTLTLEASMRDYRLAVVYALALIWIGKQFWVRPAQKVNAPIRFLLMTFLTSYVAWLIQFSIYRYAIPLEYFAGLAIIYFVSTLITSRIPQIICMTVLTFLVLITTGYPQWTTRITFGNDYFVIPTPALPPHSMILLVSNVPLAYTIPFFHSTFPVRFIGIDNNLTSPAKNNRLQTMINQAINTNSGPIFTLTYSQNNHRAKKDIRYYELTQITSQCQIIQTNTGDRLVLCPTKLLS